MPVAQRATQLLLQSSQTPTWGYLQEPRTPLHYVDARIKQLWLVTLLALSARAPVPFKVLAGGVVVGASVACLPRRLWKAQLSQLSWICALLFLSFALASEVSPVLTDRGLPPSVDGLPAASEVAGEAYRYVLVKLGPFAATQRSVRLATSSVALTLVSLQGASLVLVTSTAEELGAGVRSLLRPLGALG